MCVTQSSKIFVSTQPCFVYKVVSKLCHTYYSCINPNSRLAQRHNINLYTPKEWEEINNDWYNPENLGTEEQYIIDQEKTSAFPGFYCFSTEKRARDYIKEFKYINNPIVLMCLVPEGTHMFNGNVKIWPESDDNPSINVFKLTPIRELVA